ncbi:MAG: DUF1887 family protein [Bacteroidales bacterium]|nr:DUF1887 family protein [Bacteroidales bacterium]
MSKTLVNVITEDNPIPAFLFVKEKFELGDRIIYISAKDTEDDLDWLDEIDGVSADLVEKIILKKDGDEFKYEQICRNILAHLQKGVQYCVNLAGGTRYMALAVQNVFKGFNAQFFYVNVEDNTIIQSIFDDSIYDDDDYVYPIKYKMTVAEYMHAHALDHDLEKPDHCPLLSFEMADIMFKYCSKNLFSERDKLIIKMLRDDYRGHRKVIPIAEIENPKSKKRSPIPDIRRFLSLISFSYKDDKLTKDQIEWITGGWFEEYVYYMVMNCVKPDDAKIGVHIFRKGIKRDNELDVVFMKNNRLFVIECKSGVDTERMFNEVVYKATALREALLGVSCYSYIASLKNDPDGSLKKIAQYMDIEFWDHEIMVKKLKKTLKQLQ